jgi:hypothetical protein
LKPRFGFSSLAEFQMPSIESTLYMADRWSCMNFTSSKMKNSASGPKYAVSAMPVELR